MGLYRRNKKRKDGKVRKSRVWWMCYSADGEPHCESTKTTNKRVAQKIYDVRVGEIVEGRFRLPKSNAPRLEQFSQEFLDSTRHPNTKKRYTSSVLNLRAHFGDARLSDIDNPERIDEFKDARLAARVRAATVNRDLAVLRRMLRIAERKRLITSTQFREVEMLEERKERRQPHILTYKEEGKLLLVAPDHIRVLVILILDTGLRSGQEALALKWEDVDFEDGLISSLFSRLNPFNRRFVEVRKTARL
jgi:integrase